LESVGVDVLKEEKELKNAYDAVANQFLLTRTQNTGMVGFQNREVEQPTMLKLVARNLKGEKLLDLGCGPGIHLKTYTSRGAKGYGIDLSPEMIILAKQTCPEAQCIVGSAYKLNFPDDYFDIITCLFTLDHIQNLKKSVREIRRVLKKSGVLIFSVPHPIFYMFRDSERNKFLPSHAYFDVQPFYYEIAKGGKKFPEFPRTLGEYFKLFTDMKFGLEKFVENKPNNNWVKKYKGINTDYLKVPFLCFFVWKKL